MTDRVARYRADYIVDTCLGYPHHKLLRLLWMWFLAPWFCWHPYRSFMFLRKVSLSWGWVSISPLLVLSVFIRAKRVSNCYIPKKKNVLCSCVRLILVLVGSVKRYCCRTLRHQYDTRYVQYRATWKQKQKNKDTVAVAKTSDSW